jgi:CysZ protein
MGFWKQIGMGFNGYFKAMNLLFTKGFMKYMFFPLLINIVIFSVGLGFIKDLAGLASDSFVNWIHISEGDFWAAGALAKISKGFIAVMVYVMFLFVFVYFGGYIIIIILSPVFSIISEKAEHVLTNHAYDYPFSFKQLMIDIVRGLGIALRNVTYETLIMIAVFIGGILLSFISWVGVIFMFFVSSYFYGFSYMDYSNERYKRNIKESVKFMRKYRWVAIVNGSMFALVLFIPYIGAALSAFVSVLSVIAATVSMVEIRKIEEAESMKINQTQV